MDKKTILVIGAHMDDCEIGAGGLIIKAVRKGHRVVLVNVASDYSTWCVTKGREKEVREKILKKAKEMGVEKRFIGYGYQNVPNNLEAIRKIAEVIVDVKPNIVLAHYRFETSPSDHGVVGTIAEYAVRSADTVLGGKRTIFDWEMYAFETYLRQPLPYSPFQPDTFIDISNVIKETVDAPNYFDELYAQSEYAKGWASPIHSKVKIDYLGEEEITLRLHGEMKLTTARFRGFQCGLRYAEAYMALDKKVIGKRILQEIAE